MLKSFASAVVNTLASAPVLLVLALVIVVVASRFFLRWFVNLDPDQRRDVLRLVRALRRR